MLPIGGVMGRCNECGSKDVMLTGYCKVISTSPMDIREQFSCNHCGSLGLSKS